MVALVAGVSSVTSAAFADPAVFFNGNLATGEATFVNTLGLADAAYNAAHPGATQNSTIFRLDLTNTTGSNFTTSAGGTTVWVSTTRGGSPALNNTNGDEGNAGFTQWSVNYTYGNFNTAIAAGYRVSFFSDASRSIPYLMNAVGLNVSDWGTCCTNTGSRPDGSAAGASEIYMLFGNSTPVLVGGISTAIPGEEHFVGAIDDRNSFSSVTLVPNGIGESFGAGGILTFSTVQIGSVPSGTSVVTVGTPTIPDIDTAVSSYTTTQLNAAGVNPNFTGGTLSVASAGTVTANFTVANQGGTINTNTNTVTLSGTIANASGATSPQTLAVTGGGRVVLSGNNTFTGGVTVNGGVLQLNTTTAAGTGIIHMVDPTLVLNAAGNYTNEIRLEVAAPASGDPSIFQNTSGGLVNITGQMHETGVGGPNQYVTFDGGTTQLSNTTNAWTGVTRINSGTTLIGQTQTISGASIVNNGTLNYANTSAGTATQNISGSGAINIGGTAATTLAGNITTTGQLSVNGAGANLILSGARSGASTTGVLVNGAGASLTVADGGSIQSGQYNGVRVTGVGASVTNLGTIQNSGTGADGAVGAGVYVANAGAGGTTTVTNGSVTDTGAGSVIQGRNAGIRHENGSTDTLVVNNYGSVVGDLYNGIENTAGRLNVNNFAGGYIFGGNSISSNTGITLTNAGTIGRNVANTLTSGGYGVYANGAVQLSNQSGGLITGTLAGLQANGALSGSNAGTITATNGSAIGTNGTTGTFSNLTGGLISTSGAGYNAFQSYSGSVTLSNSGTISNTASTGTGSAVRNAAGALNVTNNAGGVLSSTNGWTIFQGSGAGSTAYIVNNGTITAAGDGYGFLTNGGNATITNNAGGIFEATGINGAILGNGSGTVDVINSGIIRGSTTNANAVIGLFGAGGSFTNLSGGQLTATGTRPALYMGSTGATTVDLQAGSTVTGVIYSGNSGSRIVYIAGTLDGAYDASTGTGTDALTLASTGSMTSADLGDGNDSLLYQGGTFSDLINAGAGTDAFTSALGAGIARTVTLSNLSGFESFTHLSGDLTLFGDSASPSAAIFAGNGTPSGTLIFNGGTNLTGAITVNGAIIRADTAGAFGTGTITTIDPTIQYNATGSYANDIVLNSSNPAGDPTRIEVGDGLIATLTGTITEASAGQPLIFGLISGATSGTTILTGANSWTGATTIEGNTTLQGTTDSISGSSILNNGALSYLQSTSGTVNQDISGIGQINVSGLGAGNALTFAGNLTNDNGIDILDGSAIVIAGNTTTSNGPAVNSDAAGISVTNLGTMTANSGAPTGTINLTAGGTIINGSVSNNTASITGGYAAVYNTGGALDVTNYGTIDGGGYGIVAQGGNGGNPTSLTLLNSGTITGGDAAVVTNDTTTTNSITNTATGIINGVNSGASLRGTSTLDNLGLITGGIGVAGLGPLTVTNSGTVSGTNAVLAGVNASDAATTITNTGTIEGGAQAIVLNSGGTVFNTGAGSILRTTNTGALNDASGIYSNGDLTLTNEGTISTVSTGLSYGVQVLGAINLNNLGAITSANYIGVRATGGGTITNTGGTITGFDAGIYSDGALTYSGTGSVTGQNAAGIATSAGGLVTLLAGGSVTGQTQGIYNNAGALTVSNAGTIRGIATDGITSFGSLTLTNTGLLISDTNSGVAVVAGGTLTNSGTITGGNNASAGYGVQNASASGSTTITNQSGGVINGGVGSILLNGAGDTTIDLQAGSTTTGQILSYADGTHTVSIAGLLNGAYNAATGSGVDNLTLAATGSMTSANLGAGNDSFLYQGGTFSGLIDAGAGTDSFTSNLGAGVARTINLANVGGFETITHQSGNLTLTGASASAGASIFAGQGTPSGTLTFNGTTGLTGDIFVNGATIRAATAGAFGTGTIHLIDPTVVYGATGAYANNISLEVQSPATADPSTLRAETGVFAILTGAITQGVGAGVDPAQPLVIDGPGTINLTNTANNWAGRTTINAGAELQGTTGTISGSDLLVNGRLIYSQSTSGTLNRNASGTGAIGVQGLAAGQTFTVASNLNMTNFGLTVFDSSALRVTGAITSATNTALFLNNTGAPGTSLLTNSGTISGVGAIYAGGQTAVTNQASGTIAATTGNTVRLVGAGSSLDNAGSITGTGTFSGVYFDSSGSVINRAGATISTTANAVNINGATGSVDNSGTISNVNTNAAVFVTGVGTVINRVGGVVSSTNGYGVQTLGAGSSATNLGTITAGQRGVSLEGINSTLTNSGAISGGNAVVVAAGATVTNSGTLTGQGGSSLVLNGTGSVANQAGGTISGSNNGIIVTTGIGTIANAGTITAQNGAGVRLAGGGSVDNLSGGSIVGGTAGGIVSAGTFTDTITLRNGSSLAGGMSLAGGNDTLTLFLGAAVSGVLDGGDDIDAFVVDGAGASSFNIGTLLNFESRALNGTGTLTLTGTDASSVAWAINAGTLAASGGSAINDAATVNVAAGGTLALLNSERIGALNGAGLVTLGANTLFLAGTSTFSGVASGTGGLTVEGGTTTLSGSNTYTGATSVTGGTLALGASNVLSDATTVAVSTGAILNLNAFNDTVALALLNGTLNGTGTLTAAQYQLNGATVNGNLGAGSLFNLGGVSTLNGTSGAGTVNVNAGTLSLGASNRLADAANVTVASGATLNLNAFNDTVALALLNGSLQGSGTLTAAQYQLNGATVNANLGAGTLFNLGGASTLNGTSAASTVNVDAGTLSLGASNRLADAANVTVASGATLNLNAFNDTVALAMLNGTLAGTGTLTAAQYQLNGATVNGNLGAGTLFNLGGVSTLTGTSAASAVNVNAGTLSLGASNRLADAANLTVASGATLNLNAFNDTVALALLNGTLNGTGTLTAAQHQLTGATVNGNLGAGTLFNLGGVSTLTGTAAASAVNVNAGTLRLGASERLDDASVISVATGATLDLNGFSERAGALFGTGSVAVGGAGRLTVGGSDFGFGGTLSGTGSLIHTAGVFTLMGNHTIANITNAGGELRFLGTTTGAMSIQGGSLTGQGTIGGILTVANGATLAPGLVGINNGIGSFTAGSLVLNGGRLAVDVLGTSGGNLIDRLTVTGNANLTGGLFVPTFQGPVTDFNFSTRYLFLQAGSVTGTFTNGSAFTADATKAGLFWRIRYDLMPNTAVLELRQMTDFDPGVAGSPNERAVGSSLTGNQTGASDEFAAVLTTLAGLSPTDRMAAFDSLSGEGLADTTTSLMASNDLFLRAIRDGGVAGRSGASTPLNFGEQLDFMGGGDSEAARLGAVLGAFDPNAAAGSGPGGWLTAYSGDQTLDGKTGQATVESRVSGLAGGFGISRGNFSIGGAAGVSRLEGEVTRRATDYEGDLSHGAVYIAYDDGAWAANLTGTYFGGRLDTTRTVQVGAITGRASGDTHGDGQSISASLSRRFQVRPNTTLALGAMATASRASTDAFTETGAGALSLQVAATDRDWQTYQLGARGTQAYQLNGKALHLYAGVGALATTGDLKADADLRLTGAPTGAGAFNVQGADAPPLAGFGEIGTQIELNDAVSLSAGYRGVYSERLEDNQFGVKLRINW